jgi:hypothetical protein
MPMKKLSLLALILASITLLSSCGLAQSAATTVGRTLQSVGRAAL